MSENLYGREFAVRCLDHPAKSETVEGWQPKDVASAWAHRHLLPGQGAQLEIRSLQSGRVWTCNVRAFKTSSVWGVEEAA